MNNSVLGRLVIILGSIVLSLEIYGTKVIQGLEMQKGTWKTSAIDYAKEMPVSLAFFITIAIIFYGIFLVVISKKK